MGSFRSARQLVIIGFLSALLVACSHPQRVSAVPDQNYTDAVVPGMENVRYFIDGDPKPITEHAFQSVDRERAWRAKNGQSADLPPANFLAVSGGGDNGAFGAGLLVGWSQTGNRPEFKIVTGISTGALIAPFAYLGPDYDAELREVYTTISPDNILIKRSLLTILSSDAAADNAPLWQLVRKHADAEMLQAIGEEYDKGRLLLIATTNLDAQRPVVWNIGEIAKSGHPKALELFHSVLVASSAIPGAFPPVMIDVTANGKPYQEMHVDGGTISQVFLYPPSINVEEASEKFGVQRERKLYVIRNARLDAEWASVERHVFGIAGRAISTLIQNQGVGDLYQIFLTSRRDNIDYNLAFIPPTFDEPHTEQFDTEYMNKLFDLGFAMGKPGYPWEKFPPGYNPSD